MINIMIIMIIIFCFLFFGFCFLILSHHHVHVTLASQSIRNAHLFLYSCAFSSCLILPNFILAPSLYLTSLIAKCHKISIDISVPSSTLHIKRNLKLSLKFL